MLVKTTVRAGLSNDTFYCEGARNIQIHLHKPTTRLYPTHTLTYMHACRCAHAHTQSVIQEHVRFIYSREDPNMSVLTGSKCACHRCCCP